ncbi:MAG: outer membrane lipoprotein-sorting protein [Bacteroidota bacterium]|nr:outer membrane lipoprotein-sorting protein [Bacteroidota bacterium]MDP4229662.1 outer membrane lipoprotein-sorting protein [Bacteroidota bacterium]
MSHSPTELTLKESHIGSGKAFLELDNALEQHNKSTPGIRMMRLVCCAIVYLIFLVFASSVSAQNARDIVRRADSRMRGSTSEAMISIRIVRPSYSREMVMKSWSKGNDLALILITSPAKEKGTIFLKRKKEVWNWLPSIERTIKLPPSMMSQSWMGTDFTNDDLVREASIVEDYEHSLLGEEVLDYGECYKIQLLPKKEAAVVWGKVILWIDKKDYLMLRAEYFDEDGKLINTMIGSDVKKLGDRLIPARMEMIPAEKPGNKTILLYSTLKFDKPIEDSFFSTQNMQKVQ